MLGQVLQRNGPGAVDLKYARFVDDPLEYEGTPGSSVRGGEVNLLFDSPLNHHHNASIQLGGSYSASEYDFVMMSFLVKGSNVEGTPPFFQFTTLGTPFGSFDPVNSPSIGYGSNATSTNFFARMERNRPNANGPQILNDQAYFVVGLFENLDNNSNTGWEAIRIWVNPDPALPWASLPPADGAATDGSTANMDIITHVGFRSFLQVSGREVRMDRAMLVFGTTAADLSDAWDDIRFANSGDGELFVDLESLSATGRPGMPVTVNWTTSSEIDNAGFHIHRLDATGLTRLTNALIAPLGDEFSGASYSFTDWAAPRGWTTMPQYFLEDVEFSGVSTLHGPAEAIILPAPDSIRVPLQPSAPSLEDPRGGGIKLPVQEEAKVPAASRQSARR